METKLAIKRLTASDLTFFEWHFRNRNAGNQKAINLNADVFINELYPALPAVTSETGGRIPIDLYLYGPGRGVPEQNLQRKIIKFGTYKNWRLDGEFIADPLEQPDRYHILEPGDLAVIEFAGSARPESARIVFLSSNLAEDSALIRLLTVDSMAALSHSRLREVVDESDAADDHPIRVLLTTGELAEAAQSGETLLLRAARQRSARTITREELAEAQLHAAAVGEEGEGLINEWLIRERIAGRVREFSWVSRENAGAPLDFAITYADKRQAEVDAKTTTADFGRPFHLSMSELRQMISSSVPYLIFRVYSLSGGDARLRISEPMSTVARNIEETVRAMPSGIGPDGLIVDPLVLKFGPELSLRSTSEELL